MLAKAKVVGFSLADKFSISALILHVPGTNRITVETNSVCMTNTQYYRMIVWMLFNVFMKEQKADKANTH